MEISAGVDTVPHIYLLRKLERFGYEDSKQEWVDSFISNRIQVVQVQASYSDFWEVI